MPSTRCDSSPTMNSSRELPAHLLFSCLPRHRTQFSDAFEYIHWTICIFVTLSLEWENYCNDDAGLVAGL